MFFYPIKYSVGYYFVFFVLIKRMKRKRESIHWKPIITYTNEEESKQFIKSEYYSVSNTDISSKGVKNRYHCSKHVNCPVCLLEHIQDENNVTLFLNGEDHCIEEKISCGNRIERVVDRYIKDISNLTPTEINLIIPDECQFTHLQLTQLKQRKKRRLNIEPLVTYIDVRNWLQKYSSSPCDLDEPYCIDSKINNEILYAAFSTKRLIHLLKENRTLQVDATYKISRLGYPVLVAGISDISRRFHPIIISISKSEKTEDYIYLFDTIKMISSKVNDQEFKLDSFMGDAASCITAAFQQSFPGRARCVCWYHAKKRMNLLVKKFCEKQFWKEILIDLAVLQISNSELEFNYHSELFINKWKDVSFVCDQFCRKFKKKWLTTLPNWYEGCNSLRPSKNNGLEAFNKYFKRNVTQHIKKNLKEVFDGTMKYLGTLSTKRRSGGECEFAYTIKKTLSQWTSAYQLSRSIILAIIENLTKFNINLIDYSITTDFIMPNSFDELKNKNYHYVTIRRYGNIILCDCKEFQKIYTCKHSLGVEIKLKIINAPLEAEIFPLEGKRKPGRPALVGGALSLQ